MTPGAIPSAPRPSIGRIVTYRSKTGAYDVPAVINCTIDTISKEGVRLGHVPPLSGNMSVHLTVFTPGKPGTAREGNEVNPAQTSGTYQEWDVPLDDPVDELPEGNPDEIAPGTWRWPERV
jgi:hypothetical protein